MALSFEVKTAGYRRSWFPNRCIGFWTIMSLSNASVYIATRPDRGIFAVPAHRRRLCLSFVTPDMDGNARFRVAVSFTVILIVLNLFQGTPTLIDATRRCFCFLVSTISLANAKANPLTSI
jgi:hypothetical protein